MLQQTRVETVIPYYLRFMARFPDLESLASAHRDEVLKLWEGLGYYRRAGFLQQGARWILERGGWPRSAAELEEVPGIGRYTAGAVASIAFGERAPLVDGNVRRVWARIFSMDDARSVEAQKVLWGLSAQAVLHGTPSEVNQALMELGALVCTPRDPGCIRCPLGRWCSSQVDGRAEQRPTSARKTPVPCFEVAVGLLWHRGRFLVQKRPEGGLLGGLWELPGGKLAPGEPARDAVAREFFEEVGFRIQLGEELPSVRHAYSHFKVVLHAFHCTLAPGQKTPSRGMTPRWITPGDIPSLAFPAATLKIFRLAFPEVELTAKAAESPGTYVPE
jgi:A/G-specific adenine glycosylase